MIDSCPICNTTPIYIGNDKYGYITCPNCHLRTLDCFDVEIETEWIHTDRAIGNSLKYKVPNAYRIAENAWKEGFTYRNND